MGKLGTFRAGNKTLLRHAPFFLVHYVILLKQVPTSMLHFVQLDSCLQGVKVALTASQVPAVSKLDHDTLHLVWTEEKLQEQLDVLDRRWEM